MQLFRSVRARDLLEIFFIAAITSLLTVRFYLYLAGFPQLGGGNFHIAHMLWGGLLMLVSISILLGFIGKRSQQLAALIGGAGFGVFIDEIGKFITSDNNYFFQPAIGIIYAIFVLLYLSFNFISRDVKLTSREYQLNALMELEEAVAHDMDESEKNRVTELLTKADPQSPITRQLLELLAGVKTVRQPRDNWWQRLLTKSDEIYSKFWQRQTSNEAVRIFFIFQALLFLVAVLVVQFTSIDEFLNIFSGEITYGVWLVVGEIISALVATVFALRGARVLKVSRLDAFEWFRRASLTNIFLTEFFSFSRIQFEALPGFFLNVLIIVLIGYVIHQERRLST